MPLLKTSYIYCLDLLYFLFPQGWCRQNDKTQLSQQCPLTMLSLLYIFALHGSCKSAHGTSILETREVQAFKSGMKVLNSVSSFLRWFGVPDWRWAQNKTSRYTSRNLMKHPEKLKCYRIFSLLFRTILISRGHAHVEGHVCFDATQQIRWRLCEVHLTCRHWIPQPLDLEPRISTPSTTWI